MRPSISVTGICVYWPIPSLNNTYLLISVKYNILWTPVPLPKPQNLWDSGRTLSTMSKNHFSKLVMMKRGKQLQILSPTMPILKRSRKLTKEKKREKAERKRREAPKWQKKWEKRYKEQKSIQRTEREQKRNRDEQIEDKERSKRKETKDISNGQRNERASLFLWSLWNLWKSNLHNV